MTKEDTCYCGHPIRWNGKYWEHVEREYRHVASPPDLDEICEIPDLTNSKKGVN